MTTPLAGDGAAVRNRKERNRLAINDVNKKISDHLLRVKLGPRAFNIRTALKRQEYDNSKLLSQIRSVEEAVGATP